jgi:hypothetical protein
MARALVGYIVYDGRFKQAVPGQTFESTQRWSLNGNVLTIESTGARGTQKMVYKKS